MRTEVQVDSLLEAKRREQSPQALARLAVVCLFISLWLVLWLARIPMPVPFLLVLTLEVAFFLAYWRTVSLLPNVRAVELAHYGMLAAEIGFHTTIVYFLGGVSWLGALAYVFGLIFANTFLDLRRGLIYTGGASLAFVGLIVLEATGVVPHYVYLEQGPLRYTDLRFVATTAVGAFGVFFSIYAWVNWVGGQLRRERDAAVRAQGDLLQARAALQEANADLERRVAERTVDLKLAHAAVSESEERYRDYYEQAPNAYMSIDAESGEVLECNQTTVDMLGCREDEIIGHKAFEFYTPESRAPAAAALESFRAHGVIDGIELQVQCKDGTVIDVVLDATAVRDETGRVVRSRSVWRDITERKGAEQALEKLRRQNELILNSAGEGIYGLDMQGRTTFVNPAAAQMIGWEIDELIGRSQHDVLHHSRADGTAYPREECPIYAAFHDGGVHHVTDEVFWRKDGTQFPVEYMSTPIRDEHGELTGAVVTFRDITERRRAEEALRDAANHDPLTGLLNRRAGLVRIEEQVEAAKKDRGRMALFVIDVDRFKSVNDVHGHEAGDQALVLLSQVMHKVIGERGIVCRMGGDEFQIGLAGAGLREARRVAEEIRAALSSALESAGEERSPPFVVSIGVACFPEDGKNTEDLGRSADSAMYAAKAAGGDRCLVWRDTTSRRAA